MRISEAMTQRGWLVSFDALSAHRKTATERVARFTEIFLSGTGLVSASMGSAGSGGTTAVRNWFLVSCNAPVTVRDKLTGKPQLNATALIEWATRDPKARYAAPAAALYGLRKNLKILEFVDRYERFAQADGRVHFGFNPAGTQTGRWTSSTRLRGGPRKTYRVNAQQIPSKEPPFDFGNGPEKLTASMRDVFIADPGHVLIKADYDQLELRLIAYVYGAQRLIRWIEEGRDVHMENAKAFFRLPDSATKKTHPAGREAAKPCAYAISYQMHDEKGGSQYPALHAQLVKTFPGISMDDVAELANTFFRLHPEIKEGQLEVARNVREKGYVTLPMDGRRLYYPATMRGINQALNFPMQATGAALVNRATIELASAFENGLAEIRAQVHDELVVQCAEADIHRVVPLVEDAMARPAQLGKTNTGIPAKGQVGASWRDTVAYKPPTGDGIS